MNEQPKHTGGEWIAKCSEFNGYAEWFIERKGDDRVIASDILDPETGLPSESNTRLIAAAPELLEALKAQERADWALRNLEAVWSDPLHPDIAALKLEMLKTRSNASILRKAAIAKAEGRGE
jgi:hypothetical protein